MRYDSDGLGVAVGTSTGHVLLYDLRSPNPTLAKDHRYVFMCAYVCMLVVEGEGGGGGASIYRWVCARVCMRVFDVNVDPNHVLTHLTCSDDCLAMVSPSLTSSTMSPPETSSQLTRKS